MSDSRSDLPPAGKDPDEDGKDSTRTPAGEPGAVGGTDGVTKNQESDAQ